LFAVGELDDDQVTGPAAFQNLGVRSVDQEPPVEGCEGGIDPFEVAGDVGAEGDRAKVGNGVGGH